MSLSGVDPRRLGPPVRYTDPNERLAGFCGTCKAVVHCLRMNAGTAPSRWGGGFTEPGTWGDLLSVECPQCKARVYLMAAGELQGVLQGEGKAIPEG